MKYIVLRRDTQEELVTRTNGGISHIDMREVFSKLPCVAAGFVVFENGALSCTGKSESLHIGSRPRDTLLLRASVEAATRIQG